MTGTLHYVGAGQNRRKVYSGIIAFVTTGATVELDVPFNTIESVQLTYVGAAAQAANGALSLNEVTAVDGDGKLVIPVLANSVTVTRAAGTDSGIAVAFEIWGK